jgi:hypothetical protein
LGECNGAATSGMTHRARAPCTPTTPPRIAPRRRKLESCESRSMHSLALGTCSDNASGIHFLTGTAGKSTATILCRTPFISVASGTGPMVRLQGHSPCNSSPISRLGPHHKMRLHSRPRVALPRRAQTGQQTAWTRRQTPKSRPRTVPTHSWAATVTRVAKNPGPRLIN